MLKDKVVATLNVPKGMTLEIEKNMEEFGISSSSIMHPHFNVKVMNEMFQSEGPRCEPSPSETLRGDDRESSKMLKFLLNMNNQILSIMSPHDQLKNLLTIGIYEPRTLIIPLNFRYDTYALMNCT